LREDERQMRENLINEIERETFERVYREYEG
jgi:hypothetical protein